MKGFREEFETVSAGLGSLEEVSGAGLTGEEEDARLRTELADGEDRVHAIHFGHYDIRQDDVWALLAHKIDCALACVECGCLEAVSRKNLGQAVGNRRLVVNDDNAAWTRFCL